MMKGRTIIIKLIIARDLKEWIRAHLEWNRGIMHSKNIRSCLNTKEKNSDYGEARDSKIIQTKVMVADNPRNKRMIQGSQHWKHRIKNLTTR